MQKKLFFINTRIPTLEFIKLEASTLFLRNSMDKVQEESPMNLYSGSKVAAFLMHKRDGLQFNVLTEVFMIDLQFHLVSS